METLRGLCDSQGLCSPYANLELSGMLGRDVPELATCSYLLNISEMK